MRQKATAFIILGRLVTSATIGRPPAPLVVLVPFIRCASGDTDLHVPLSLSRCSTAVHPLALEWSEKSSGYGTATGDAVRLCSTHGHGYRERCVDFVDNVVRRHLAGLRHAGLGARLRDMDALVESVLGYELAPFWKLRRRCIITALVSAAKPISSSIAIIGDGVGLTGAVLTSIPLASAVTVYSECRATEMIAYEYFKYEHVSKFSVVCGEVAADSDAFQVYDLVLFGGGSWSYVSLLENLNLAQRFGKSGAFVLVEDCKYDSGETFSTHAFSTSQAWLHADSYGIVDLLDTDCCSICAGRYRELDHGRDESVFIHFISPQHQAEDWKPRMTEVFVSLSLDLRAGAGADAVRAKPEVKFRRAL